MIAGIKVDRGNSTVGRLGQRQSLGTSYILRATSCVLQIGLFRIGINQLRNDGNCRGRDIKKSGFRIERSPRPPATTTPAREVDGSAQGGRSKHCAVIEGLDILQGFSSQLRGEIDQSFIRNTLLRERSGLGGEWLGCRYSFTWHAALRDSTLLDRPYRLTAYSIKHIGKTLL